MAKSRRVASAKPPASAAARVFGGGMQLGARARELSRALLDGFKTYDLLTYASAISFQILTAIIRAQATGTLSGARQLDSLERH